MGQQPGDLGEVITKIALGSPAISALRSFGRVWSLAEITDTLEILSLPLSREASYIDDLKRTLVAYRMVFGKPRQEDLLRFLTTHFQDDEELKEFLNYRIDLRPRVIGV